MIDKKINKKFGGALKLTKNNFNNNNNKILIYLKNLYFDSEYWLYYKYFFRKYY